MGTTTHPLSNTRILRWCLFAVVIGLVATATATAETEIVYNSIPTPIPVNVYASGGPEAYGFAEMGDGLGLTVTSGTLAEVSVVLSSWACQSGGWVSGCTTRAHATFRQPITISVYSVTQEYSAVYEEVVPTPSSLLGTITHTFDIPYRPTSTPGSCDGNVEEWYSSTDKACHRGISAEVSFDFSDQHLAIPANGQIIVAVGYNTTHYGPHPIGSAPCLTTSGGCPYDSLNIGTYGSGPAGLAGGVGSLLDTNGVFVDYTKSEFACSGNTVTGTLALDAPCWTGYHPLVKVQASTSLRRGPHGYGP